MKIYDVPEIKLTSFKKSIVSINKKNKKYGLKEITYEVGESFEKEFIYKNAPYYLSCVLVTVKREPPILNGWRFVAYLKPIGDKINLIEGQDTEIPKRYKNQVGQCEHCQVNRLRKYTYIVEKDGVFKQVGKTCLEAFLGCKNPIKVASLYEAAVELEKMFDNIYNPEDNIWKEEVLKTPQAQYIYTGINTMKALESAAYYIEKYGYHKYDVYSSGEQATSQRIRDYCYYNIDKDIIPSDVQKQLAQDAYDWALKLDVSNNNNYYWNIKAVCENKFLPSRDLGVVASIIPAYTKSLAKPVDQSDYYGTPDTWADLELELTYKKAFNSHWGKAYLHKFRDKNQNMFTWFSSKPTELKFAKTYSIRAFIKKHDTFRGTKQTFINRCKVGEILK